MAKKSASRQMWSWLFNLTWLTVLLSHGQDGVSAQLDMNYYANTCGQVQNIVRSWLTANVFTDPTGPAALVRLLFHDCQVGGCDASIMLDTQPGIVSEMVSDGNFGIRDLRFIDSIKGAVELICPNVVSCADIIALAARDCVSITQGPFIQIPLGRRDGVQASNIQADKLLPPTDISVPNMLAEFGQMGMTAEESVAILGAHTIGVGHCVNVLNRIYPTVDPVLQPAMATSLLNQCPTANPGSLNNGSILSNDNSNFFFDNQYFKDVQNGRGLFKIDSNMAFDPISAPIVAHFANSQADFFTTFSSAFVKMANFRVLTGTEGEIRKNCHMVNS